MASNVLKFPRAFSPFAQSKQKDWKNFVGSTRETLPTQFLFLRKSYAFVASTLLNVWKISQPQLHFVFFRANFVALFVIEATGCSPKPDHLSSRRRKSILILQRRAASGICYLYLKKGHFFSLPRDLEKEFTGNK